MDCGPAALTGIIENVRDHIPLRLRQRCGIPLMIPFVSMPLVIAITRRPFRRRLRISADSRRFDPDDSFRLDRLDQGRHRNRGSGTRAKQFHQLAGRRQWMLENQVSQCLPFHCLHLWERAFALSSFHLDIQSVKVELYDFSNTLKETNQRKGPSPTKHICQASLVGMFRLANPWLGRNTTHIPVRRPAGLEAWPEILFRFQRRDCRDRFRSFSSRLYQ